MRSKFLSTPNCSHQKTCVHCCFVGTVMVARCSPGSRVHPWFPHCGRHRVFQHISAAPAVNCKGRQSYFSLTVPKNSLTTWCVVLPEHADDIFRLTQEDISKKFATGLLSREEVDQMHGVGGWRPMIRFVHTQAKWSTKSHKCRKEGATRVVHFNERDHLYHWHRLDCRSGICFAAQALRAWGQPKRWTAPFPSWIFRMHTGDARAIPKI